MSVADIARPEIRDLKAYVAGAQIDGAVRLNANESARSPWAALDRTPLNRYPPVRPMELQRRMAELYGVSPANVLATRGSTEAIDTLMRTFCRAYRDNVVVMPPTFGMYQVYADVQAVALKTVPLEPKRDFALDVDAVLAAADAHSKLIFVCTPNNPTGTAVTRADILRIAATQADRSVVVVDEAYVEFADCDSVADATASHDNLVVLRTMSKAFALAGARCGALIGSEEVVRMLSRVLPPYSFSIPVTERVLDAMTPAGLRKAKTLVRETIAEREKLSAALRSLEIVETVWPSQANFLFVRFRNVEAVRQQLDKRKILIREFANLPDYPGCARISLGTPAENGMLIDALRSVGR